MGGGGWWGFEGISNEFLPHFLGKGSKFERIYVEMGRENHNLDNNFGLLAFWCFFRGFCLVPVAFFWALSSHRFVEVVECDSVVSKTC